MSNVFEHNGKVYKTKSKMAANAVIFSLYEKVENVWEKVSFEAITNKALVLGVA